MKKKLFIPLLFIIIFGIFVSGNSIFAIEGAEPTDDSTSECGDSPVCNVQDVFQVLTNILNLMYTAFFIIAIMFILIAAFNYLFAQDDPEKIKSATRQIMWAAVAIIIALLSVGAGTIVENFLKGKSAVIDYNLKINTAVAVEAIKGEIIQPGKKLGETGGGSIKTTGDIPKGIYETVKADVGGVMNIVAGVIQVMYTMLFVLAVGFAILAGYTYLFAAEDPEKIKTAHKQLMWTAVAVAVGLLSVGINQIVEKFIKG